MLLLIMIIDEITDIAAFYKSNLLFYSVIVSKRKLDSEPKIVPA